MIRMGENEKRTLQEAADEAAAMSPQGVSCPRCKFDGIMPVIATVRRGNTTHRRRQCRRCGLRILCSERVIGVVQQREKFTP
jgi:DNA-directed RNA polymerase subunit RPC12/RpoP